MGHLFLDIETYSSQKDADSSLNPYKEEAKVILIAYNYYDSFKPPKKEEIKPPVFLKEWESTEKGILEKFYAFLKETKSKDKYLKITGFNVTKFDLPYLFGRMKLHSIASEQELHDLLFRPFGIDLFQLSAIISQKTKQFEQLWGINHKDTTAFFKLQEKEATGLDCTKYYDSKEYNKIIQYSTQEFNFEQLLDGFYLHVMEKMREK